MVQIAFANKVVERIKTDPSIVGLAVGGSWLTQEMDCYSDLDLTLITHASISKDKNKMLAYAHQFGNLLTGFTGEHVGEPRLLICLYNNPLLHVDIKFLTPDEFKKRIENPVILWDTDNILQKIITETNAQFPYPSYQWIEDRFWVWIHYALTKIGRGEYLEAFDFLGFLRLTVFGPLLQIKHNHLPRGVRKLERQIARNDFEKIQSTIPIYSKESILQSIENAIILYKELRILIFQNNIQLQIDTEKKVLKYFEEISSQQS